MDSKTTLSPVEFFRGCPDLTVADKQAILDSLQEAVGRESDRLFVQLGVGSARSTVGIITALNALEIPCNLLSIDSHPSAKFAWDSLCSGIRGSCQSHFSNEVRLRDVGMDFSYYGPVWVLIDGCACHRCVKGYLKFWGGRIVLDGFLAMTRAHELLEGTKIASPYHLDAGVEVRCGVLRAVESDQRIAESYAPWRFIENGSMRIWIRER